MTAVDKQTLVTFADNCQKKFENQIEIYKKNIFAEFQKHIDESVRGLLKDDDFVKNDKNHWTKVQFINYNINISPPYDDEYKIAILAQSHSSADEYYITNYGNIISIISYSDGRNTYSWYYRNPIKIKLTQLQADILYGINSFHYVRNEHSINIWDSLEKVRDIQIENAQLHKDIKRQNEEIKQLLTKCKEKDIKIADLLIKEPIATKTIEEQTKTIKRQNEEIKQLLTKCKEKDIKIADLLVKEPIAIKTIEEQTKTLEEQTKTIESQNNKIKELLTKCKEKDIKIANLLVKEPIATKTIEEQTKTIEIQNNKIKELSNTIQCQNNENTEEQNDILNVIVIKKRQ